MARCVILPVLASLSAFSQIGPEKDAPEKETTLGRVLVAHVDASTKTIADPEVTALLEGVLNALSVGQRPRVPVTLKVLDTPDPIASTLPGGFLLLSTGAILRANSEAELAALLAHALAHMQAEPVVRVGFVEWVECRRSGTENLIPIRRQDEAQEAEEHADMLALDQLAHAGYDVTALVGVYERWGRFPPSDAVKARALSIGVGSPRVNTSGFDKIKARLTPPPVRPPTLYR